MRFRVLAFTSLVLVIVGLAGVSAQQPQPPPTQRQFNFSTPLFQQPNVGTALNLTPAQTRQLTEMNTRLQTDWRDRFNKAWSATGRERDANLQQLQTQYNDAWMKGTGDIFNKTQAERYRQLQLQSEGPAVFANPTVRQRLDLTPEQQQQLGDLRTRFDTQFRGIDPTRDRTDATKQWETLRQETNDKIRGILNEQQRRTWSEMTGEAFKFAPPFSTPTPPR
jgi:hypothetical protein